jgi:hypothetical protein
MCILLSLSISLPSYGFLLFSWLLFLVIFVLVFNNDLSSSHDSFLLSNYLADSFDVVPFDATLLLP